MRSSNRVPWLAVVATFVTGSVAFAGTYIYPKKGQSKQQQDKDKGACTVWATDQTGFDPANPPPPPAAPSARGAATTPHFERQHSVRAQRVTRRRPRRSAGRHRRSDCR